MWSDLNNSENSLLARSSADLICNKPAIMLPMLAYFPFREHSIEKIVKKGMNISYRDLQGVRLGLLKKPLSALIHLQLPLICRPVLEAFGLFERLVALIGVHRQEGVSLNI